MRAVAAWVCVAAWAWLSFLQASGTTEMTPWRKVVMEPTSLNKSTATEVFRALRTTTLCGMACVKEAWCSLWCFTAPTDCRLTSYIVSASYVPTQPIGALLCYTKMKKDLAVGSVPTSSYRSRVFTLRMVQNLVDGYYSHNIEEVGLAEDAPPDGAWFQFDLGRVVTVTEVVLTAQPDDDASEFFRDIEVRVGVSPVPSPGVFSPFFTLLGTFAGPGVKDERVVLRPPEPLHASYITIQRKSSGDFQIAHLEIY